MDPTSRKPSGLSAHSAGVRKQFDAEVLRAPQDILTSFDNAVRGPSQRVVQSVGPVEDRLHDIWYLLIEAAKHTDASSPLQDSLALQTLMVRQLADVVFDSAGESLCADLPFLGADLQAAWHDLDINGDDETRRRDHKRNLAAFMARLFAACDEPAALQDSLTACALEVFKETLETQRTSAELVSMLPLVISWFQFGARKLAIASCERKRPGWTVAPGPLIVEADAGISFSQARFGHWTRRVKQLGESDDDEVKKLAHAAEYWVEEWMHVLPRLVSDTLR